MPDSKSRPIDLLEAHGNVGFPSYLPELGLGDPL
jgi:hypothetical protein